LEKDTYKTLAEPSPEVLYKEKGSKFYGYAFPVLSEEDIKIKLEEIKSKHHAARHWCYAWQLGHNTKTYRVNDDGEPRNSAGMPIYGQIQSFEITNVLIVVVRYFGGTKLGVGGLIQAYKTAARLALDNAGIIEKTVEVIYVLNFDYALINKVMRIIKENSLQITDQKSSLKCSLTIRVRKNDALKIKKTFASVYGVELLKRS
jgi:uncharacterized YigZ family protein